MPPSHTLKEPSQPYFPPCAHAREISGWGEGRGKYVWNVKNHMKPVVASLQRLHSVLGDDG